MKVTEKENERVHCKIEKITIHITEAYIQNDISNLNALLERKKLTLWIVGLATALELYILNQYAWTELIGFSAFLFASSVVLFLINSIGALYFNKVVTNLYLIKVQNQNNFNLQRMNVLNALTLNDELAKKLAKDLESDHLIPNLIALEYIEKANKTNNSILKLADKMVHISDSNASYLLILQLIVSIILFLIN